MRNKIENIKQTNQNQHRSLLLQEGLSGVTIKDTLPDTSLPLTHESETMYFKCARDFLNTSLAYFILHEHQDIPINYIYKNILQE